MKKLKARKEIKCMACMACVQECAGTYSASNLPEYAAVRLEASKDDPDTMRPVICIQCGKCALSCPNNAIVRNEEGIYVVDKEQCTGCGICVDACPFGVMRKPADSRAAFKCVACGKCANACPMELLILT